MLWERTHTAMYVATLHYPEDGGSMFVQNIGHTAQITSCHHPKLEKMLSIK